MFVKQKDFEDPETSKNSCKIYSNFYPLNFETEDQDGNVLVTSLLKEIHVILVGY